MKTQRKKRNILKLLAMSFAVVLLLWNCKKDENLEDIPHIEFKTSEKPFMEKVSLSQVLSIESLKFKIEDINKKRNSNDVSRFSLTDSSFTILTDGIAHMITEDKESYTFLLDRPAVDNATFSQLVLERFLNEDNYTVWVYNFVLNQNRLIVSKAELDDTLDLNNRYAMIGDCLFWVEEYTNGVEYILIGCGGGGGSGEGDSGSGNSGSGDSGSGDSGSGYSGSGHGESGNLGYSGDSGSGLDGESSGGGGSSPTSTGETFTSPFFIPIIPTIEEILTDQYFDNLTSDQQDCLDAHPGLEMQINKFLLANINPPSLEENGNTPTPDPATVFTDEAIETACNGGSADIPNRVILSPSFENNQKVKCVYDNLKLMSNTIFNDIVNDNFGGDKICNIQFDVGSIPVQLGDVEAFTYTSYSSTGSNMGYDGIMHIRIDPDFIDSASTIEIALMLIHESIHAELLARGIELEIVSSVNTLGYIGLSGINSPVTFQDDIFNELINHYYYYSSTSPTTTSSQWNHNLFTALGYREKLQQNLVDVSSFLSNANFDYVDSINNDPQNPMSSNYTFTNELIMEYLSWKGLEATESFYELITSDPNEELKEEFIKNNITNHFTHECN